MPSQNKISKAFLNSVRSKKEELIKAKEEIELLKKGKNL